MVCNESMEKLRSKKNRDRHEDNKIVYCICIEEPTKTTTQIERWTAK